MSGRVGEHLMLFQWNHYDSDLGTQALRETGWLINIMIENNLFYTTQPHVLKQGYVESLHGRNTTNGVQKKQAIDRKQDAILREKSNVHPDRVVTRHSLYRPWHEGKTRGEHWWQTDLSRERKRKPKPWYEMFFRTEWEKEDYPYYDDKYNIKRGARSNVLDEALDGGTTCFKIRLFKPILPSSTPTGTSGP